MGDVEPSDKTRAVLEAGIKEVLRELSENAANEIMGLMAKARGNRLVAFRNGLQQFRSRLPSYEEKMLALYLDFGVWDDVAATDRIAKEMRDAAEAIADSAAQSFRGAERAAALREAMLFKASVGGYVGGTHDRALVAVERRRRQDSARTAGGGEHPLDRGGLSAESVDMTDFGQVFSDVLANSGSEVEVTRDAGEQTESRRKARTLKNREKNYPRREYFGFAPAEDIRVGDILQLTGTNDRWTVIDTETQVAMNSPVQLKAFVEKVKIDPRLPHSSARVIVPTGMHKVFIVHGQDDEAKLAVQLFLERLDVQGVVLHEQPNKGLTIIEKFEAHSDVDFAVVLLTPDDVGGPAGTTPGDLKRRARQNVVLELGYFFGRLGRGRVCALLKGEVEIPSDIGGVAWVKMDQAGAWKTALAREMMEAKVKVDMSRLLTS